VSVICTFNLNTDENRWRTAILTLLMEHVRINYESHCITGMLPHTQKVRPCSTDPTSGCLSKSSCYGLRVTSTRRGFP